MLFSSHFMIFETLIPFLFLSICILSTDLHPPIPLTAQLWLSSPKAVVKSSFTSIRFKNTLPSLNAIQYNYIYVTTNKEEIGVSSVTSG